MISGDEHVQEPARPFDGTGKAMIGRRKTALVVDPAEPIRRLAAAALRGLQFERIILVEGAEEAEETLVTVAIDLALVDWELGPRSGFDLAADIRVGRVPPRSDVPIIMMTWKAEPRSVLAAQALRLNGLIVKPLSRAALERKVTAVLDPQAAVVPPIKAKPKRFLGQPL